MERGTIKFFNATKGYGFIVADAAEGETAKEYFVHVSYCNGYTPMEKDVVTFEVAQGDKGLMAVNVSKAA